jgi:glycerol-3-phosphate dehydrogenase (NAD(P)+)
MLAEELKVCTPIVNEVYSVLFDEKDPVRATTDLMTRDMRSE